jgi:hypothetical protein
VTAAAAASACRPATVVGEEPPNAVAEQRVVDCRRRTTGERDQVGGDLALLAQVALEVQA